MNHNSITNDYIRNVNIDFENIDEKSLDFKKGDIVEAVVSESSVNPDKVKLNFENGDAVLADKKFINAKPGEKIFIEIKDNSNGNFIIKQVQTQPNTQADNNVSTRSEADYDTLLSKINVAFTKENAAYVKFLNENNAAVKAENIKTLAEIKKNIDYITKNADENVIQKIQSAGIDVGKLSPNVLSKFIFEIKNNNFSFEQNSDYLPQFEKVSDENAQNIAKEYIKENLKISSDLNKKSNNDTKINSDRKSNTDIKTDSDKKPNNDIKTDSDKKPNTDIKTDSDKKPNNDIKTDSDKKLNTNIKTDSNKKPNTDIKTDSDKKHNNDIKTDSDKKHNTDIKTDSNKKPNNDIKTDSNKKPNNNIKTDSDKKSNTDIKTDSDKKPNTDIKTDLDKKPNNDIKTDSDKKHNTDIKTDSDKKPNNDIKTDTSKKPNTDIKTDTSKKPNTDVKTDLDKKPNTNIKTDSDKQYQNNIKNDTRYNNIRSNFYQSYYNFKTKNNFAYNNSFDKAFNEPENQEVISKSKFNEAAFSEKVNVNNDTTEKFYVTENKTNTEIETGKIKEISESSDDNKKINNDNILKPDVNSEEPLKESLKENFSENDTSMNKNHSTDVSDSDSKKAELNKNNFINRFNFNRRNFFNYSKRNTYKSESNIEIDVETNFEKSFAKTNSSNEKSDVILKDTYSKLENIAENKNSDFNDVPKLENTDDNKNINNDVDDNTIVINDKEFESADIKKIQNKFKLSNEDLEVIIKSIIKAEVPLNQKNIETVARAYYKAKNITDLSDKAILNILKNDKDLTIKNVSIAEHIPARDDSIKNISENQWKQLEKEIVKLFERENIQPSKENIDIAKTFIKNSIPVTKENFQKADFLKNFKNNVDLENVALDAADNIKLDKKIEDVILFETQNLDINKQPNQLYEDYKQIIDIIPKISTSVIKNVIKNDDVLSLENLKNEFLKNFDEQNFNTDDVEVNQSNEHNNHNNFQNDNLNHNLNKDSINNSNFIKPQKTEIKEHKFERTENKAEDNNKDSSDFYYSNSKMLENTNNSQLSPEIVTAKRQLAELQLKLTLEAANRLVGKGIDINVMPIKEAVEELKQLEKEVYESNLRIVGAEPSEENIQKMSEIFEKKESLAPRYSDYVYREIITKNVDFTIDAIDFAVNSKFDKIMDTFDTFATVPSQKFGDTFASVLNQISHVLEINGISVTDENISAAKILSLNNMDINQDNILQTKSVNFKVQKTYNNLHPLVAAEMIKDGLNPVDMNIDDVISYIDKFDQKYNQDSKEQIAENILKVAENNSISQTQKEAVISVYRMLDMISKHSSAAIGTAIKNNSELTLGNLMEASKVFEKTKSKRDFDVQINDTFGLAQDKIVPDKNIRASIEKAMPSNLQKQNTFVSQNSFISQNNFESMDLLNDDFNNNINNNFDKHFTPAENEAEYTEMIFNEIIKSAEPAKITELVKNGNNPILSNVEKFLKDIKNTKADNSDFDFNNKEAIRTVLEQIKQSSDSPSNVLSWINKNNIPVTMSNFGLAAGIIKNPFKTGKDLEKFEKDSKDNKFDFGDKISSSDLEALKNGKSPSEVVDELIEDVEGVFEAVAQKGSVEEINLLLKQSSNIKKALAVQNKINNSDNGFYQLPVRMSRGNIVNLNMYVLENASLDENSKTFMSFETKNLGVVQVYMTMKDNSAYIEINSQYSSGTNALAAYAEDLKSMLSSSNINVKSVKFGQEEPKNITDEKLFEKNSQKNVKIFDNSYEIIV